MRPLFLFLIVIFTFSCEQTETKSQSAGSHFHVDEYFNYGDTGIRSAGVKMIPITTPVGNFKVWTKRFGNNPAIKVLLLHGCPASTHEYLESFESFFPQEGFEFYE